jgi:hypothetical protein
VTQNEVVLSVISEISEHSHILENDRFERFINVKANSEGVNLFAPDTVCWGTFAAAVESVTYCATPTLRMSQ